MRSLYSTFVIVTLAVMFVSGLFAFILSNAYYQHVLKPQNDDKYINIALEIADYTEDQNVASLHDHLEFISDMGYQLYLVGEDGYTAFFGEPFRSAVLDDNVTEEVLNGEIYHGMADFPRETFVTGFFANELENSVGVPLVYNETDYALFLRPDLTLHFNEMRFLFAWLLGLTILFSLVFELILAKYLISPLSKLNEATKKIKEGNFSLSLDFKRKDEIGELASSFQDMSNQLDEMENMRNEFISNISHDIQSPLSNINGYTELLSKESITKEEKEEYLSIIRGESNRLSTMTSQLLLLSSVNQLTKVRNKETFSVSRQIKTLITNYKWKIIDNEIGLHYSFPDIIYTGDPALLLSVWDNLLSNAVKYNKRGGSISIEITEDAEKIQVIFKDTGIGIPQEKLESIFERFYRADISRTKVIKGSGLGMAIAERIVSLHGGKIHVESEEDTGSTFNVILPKSKM